MSTTNGSLDDALPRYKNLVIETLGADGNWSRYQDEDVALHKESSTIADDNVRPEVEELPSSALLEEGLAYGTDIALSPQQNDVILTEHDAAVQKDHLPSIHTDAHPDQQLYNSTPHCQRNLSRSAPQISIFSMTSTVSPHPVLTVPSYCRIFLTFCRTSHTFGTPLYRSIRLWSHHSFSSSPLS